MMWLIEFVTGLQSQEYCMITALIFIAFELGLFFLSLYLK